MTANPYKGEVEFRIAGTAEPYILRFDWNALAKLRQKYGEGYNGKVNQAIKGLDVAELAEIAAIGLAAHHPEMDPEAVIELSPPLVLFYRALQEAFIFSLFGPEDLPADDTAEETAPGKKVAPKKKKARKETAPSNGTGSAPP